MKNDVDKYSIAPTIAAFSIPARFNAPITTASNASCGKSDNQAIWRTMGNGEAIYQHFLNLVNKKKLTYGSTFITADV